MGILVLVFGLLPGCALQPAAPRSSSTDIQTPYNGHVRPPDAIKDENPRTDKREVVHINDHVSSTDTTKHENPGTCKDREFHIKYEYAEAYKSDSASAGDEEQQGKTDNQRSTSKNINPFETFLKARQLNDKTSSVKNPDSSNALTSKEKGGHDKRGEVPDVPKGKDLFARGGNDTSSADPMDKKRVTGSGGNAVTAPAEPNRDPQDAISEEDSLADGNGPQEEDFEPIEAKKKNHLDRPPLTEGETVQVELAFDNADLFEVLDATLFELFQINYIIDPHIKAKVSFHFSGRYTQKQFIELLNEILQLSKLSITGGSGEIYKVVRKSESAALSTDPLLQGGLPESSGDISRLIKLKYVDAASVSKSVRTFASKGAPISVDTVNNTIIVTDTRENVEKIIRIISMMDIPYFMDIAWRIFPVKEAEAKDLVTDITKIIRSSGLYYRPGAVKGGYQILSIDSMNAVLVVTRWPEMLELVEKWVAAMDHMGGDAGGGTGVFVYFVENGTAVELADILTQLYGGKKSDSSEKTQIVESTASSAKDKAKGDTGKNELPPPPNLLAGNVSGDLSGDVEIISDETNNAIVFKASQRDYKIIKSVLKELDVVPRQVLINVVIAEVTLSDKIQYGVQWWMNHTFGDYEALSTWNGTSDTILTSGKFTYGIYNSSDVLKALASVVDSDTELNVLSSPNIMAVDNKEAYIEVGTDVPIVTGTVSETDGTTTETIQYQKTGIILTVTPHINSSGLVKLELSQEVSGISSSAETTTSNVVISTRKAETSLVVHDGQTILLGGLMKNEADNKKSGVPLFKDIPILGHLFSATEKSNDKTELIFLLTPHVVDSRSDADRVTREFAGKIKSIKELIGTED